MSRNITSTYVIEYTNYFFLSFYCTKSACICTQRGGIMAPVLDSARSRKTLEELAEQHALIPSRNHFLRASLLQPTLDPVWCLGSRRKGEGGPSPISAIASMGVKAAHHVKSDEVGVFTTKSNRSDFSYHFSRRISPPERENTSFLTAFCPFPSELSLCLCWS